MVQRDHHDLRDFTSAAPCDVAQQSFSLSLANASVGRESNLPSLAA
jgi:hypothetical protein